MSINTLTDINNIQSYNNTNNFNKTRSIAQKMKGEAKNIWRSKHYRMQL